MIKVKDEIKKIKSMDRKAATDYVIMYYLPATIGIAVALYFIISTISQVVNNKQLEPVVRAGILNELEMHCGDGINDTLSRAFPDASGKYAPIKRTFSSPDESENMFSSIELSSYIAAGDIDLILGDRKTAELLSESGGLVSTTDISDTALGHLAGNAGISPLYYIYFTERAGAENSAYLLKFIQTDE
ncbi:MAG: hypothetical protein MJ059_06365 [Lachnospiraceae bacterium]|nr:hypothetical protein [Lachnospiraceae bacterium]